MLKTDGEIEKETKHRLCDHGDERESEVDKDNEWVLPTKNHKSYRGHVNLMQGRSSTFGCGMVCHFKCQKSSFVSNDGF